MYTKTTIPDLNPGETGYTLDTGETVAASATVNRDPVHHLLTCTVSVRLLNADGTPVLDDHGVPVATAHTHSTTIEYLSTLGGQAGLVMQTLKIALGEPDAIAAVSDHVRNAAAAAKATAAVFDLSALS